MGALAVAVLLVVFVSSAALRGRVEAATDAAIEEANPGKVVAVGCGGVAAVGILGILGGMIAIGLLASQ